MSTFWMLSASTEVRVALCRRRISAHLASTEAPDAYLEGFRWDQSKFNTQRHSLQALTELIMKVRRPPGILSLCADVLGCARSKSHTLKVP